jgi:hypothetical protein
VKGHADERLYLVCVHYALKSPEDWEWINRHLTVKYDFVVPRLAHDLCYLRRVLRPRPGKDGQVWRGFAFIFLDPGWTSLLSQTPGAFGMAALGADLNAAQSAIETRLDQSPILHGVSEPRRERVITAGNLLYLLDSLDAAARGRGDTFYRLFAGGAQTLRYDAPKVVEAAIRIANIGRGIPLFRFDDDVIFHGRRSAAIRTQEDPDSAADAEAENVLRLCGRYQDTLKDPLVRYFVYSGSYEAPVGQLGACPDNDPRLLNGFATRVLQLAQLPEQRNRRTEDTTEGTIRASVVEAFLEEMVELGANPFRQVVSGAGLCLSDGAILDLPPYSNMHLNVMWIDDHLKYALHDELGHFGRWTRTHHTYEARVHEAHFPQLRHGRRAGGPLFTYKDVRWHLQTYMLRLLLGCVADAWLRGRHEVKQATHSLSKDAYDALVQSVPHIYAGRFMEVLPGGWEPFPGKPSPEQFKEDLWRRGCQRLQRAVASWSDSLYEQTFLGLFAQGAAHSRYEEFKEFLPAAMPEGLAKAVQGLPDQYQNAQRPSANAALDDLSLQEALVTLVDDFVGYMTLVQFWPFFVQSVRCLQNQHAQYLRKDLEWMFPVPEHSA